MKSMRARSRPWQTCSGGASAREIVVGQSMTMLTFQMSRSLGHDWRAGDEIVVTRMDHEGNVSPWLRLAEERGLTVRWLSFNRDSWRIEPEDLKPLLNERTRLLALNYASNLTGSINPVAALTRMAKEAGALVYVDAVQFVPHGKAEVLHLGCDFLVCSSYKFFGPHLGVLWGREALLAEVYPYAVRCAPRRPPGRHDTGTPQTELLAGLAAAVDYLEWLGAHTGTAGTRREHISGAYRAATAYEMPLAQHLIDELVRIPRTQSPRHHASGPASRARADRVRHAPPTCQQHAGARACRPGHQRLVGPQLRLGSIAGAGTGRCAKACCASAWRTTTRSAEVERIIGALRTLLR